MPPRHATAGPARRHADESTPSRDSGPGDRHRRPGCLHYRFSRFVVPVVSGSPRRPCRQHRAGASALDGLLRGTGHDRLGTRVPRALLLLPEGRRGSRAAAIQRTDAGPRHTIEPPVRRPRAAGAVIAAASGAVQDFRGACRRLWHAGSAVRADDRVRSRHSLLRDRPADGVVRGSGNGVSDGQRQADRLLAGRRRPRRRLGGIRLEAPAGGPRRFDLRHRGRYHAVTIALMAPDLSVVIPIKNEAPNLSNLYREFTDALEAWGRPYELVLIDDGSTDESFTLLADLQAKDPRVRVIRFRRNFGQTAAFAAGFKFARGRLIATADGDLQNDPRDLPRMVDLIDGGQDIVCGWRKDRKDTFVTRRLPSMIANRLISWSTGVRLHDYGCSLK